MQDKERELEDIRIHLKDVREELRQNRQQLTEMTTAGNGLKKQVSELEKTNTLLTIQLTSAKESIALLADASKTISSFVQAFQYQIDQAKAETKAQESIVATLEVAREVSEQQLVDLSTELNNRIDEMKTEIRRLEDEAETTKTAYAVSEEQQIRGLRSQADEANAQRDAAIEESRLAKEDFDIKLVNAKYEWRKLAICLVDASQTSDQRISNTDLGPLLDRDSSLTDPGSLYVSVAFSGAQKMAEHYHGVNLPDAGGSILTLLQLLYGESESPLRVNHLARMQWVVQKLMPLIHGAHGTDNNQPSVMVVVVSALLQRNIKLRRGMPFCIAVCALVDLHNHYPFRNANDWDEIVLKLFVDIPISTFDNRLEIACIARLARSMSSTDSMVKLIGASPVDQIASITSTMPIPDVMTRLFSPRLEDLSKVECCVDVQRDSGRLYIVWDGNFETVFQQDSDEVWSVSMQPVKIEFVNGVFRASWGAGMTVDVVWYLNDKSFVDRYMLARHRQQVNDLARARLKEKMEDVLRKNPRLLGKDPMTGVRS